MRVRQLRRLAPVDERRRPGRTSAARAPPFRPRDDRRRRRLRHARRAKVRIVQPGHVLRMNTNTARRAQLAEARRLEAPISVTHNWPPCVRRSRLVHDVARRARSSREGEHQLEASANGVAAASPRSTRLSSDAAAGASSPCASCGADRQRGELLRQISERAESCGRPRARFATRLSPLDAAGDVDLPILVLAGCGSSHTAASI